MDLTPEPVNPAEVSAELLTDDELASMALGALDDVELAAVERRAVSDPAALGRLNGYLRAVAVMAETVSVEASAAVLDRVMSAALAARPRGRPSGLAPRIDEVESFRRTATSLLAVVDELPADAWSRITFNGLTVHALVSHLVGVERYVASQLGLMAPDAPWQCDHVDAARPSVDRLAQRPCAEVVEELHTTVAAVLGRLSEIVAAGSGPDGGAALTMPASFHGVDVTLGQLLVIRTFEMWTHEEDLRRAVGRTLEPPDEQRLVLMTDLAVSLLPAMIASQGRSRPGVTAQVVLTGRGGGSWLVPLAPGADVGEPDAVVVADAVEFCRLAAARSNRADVASHLEGDPALADVLLAGVSALAVD